MKISWDGDNSAGISVLQIEGEDCMSVDSGKDAPAPVLIDTKGVRWIRPGLQSREVSSEQFHDLFGEFTHLYRIERPCTASVNLGGQRLELAYKPGDILAAANTKSIKNFTASLQRYGIPLDAISEGVGGYRGGTAKEYDRLRE